MFDELCSVFRDIIHDAIEENMDGWTELEAILSERNAEGICIQFVDDGLAISVGEELYSISIQKV